MLRIFVLCLALLSGFVSEALGVDIAISAQQDYDHYQPCINATPNNPFQLYILAVGEHDLTGAEFRIVGLPAGWLANLVSSPGVAVLGSPFDGTGVNVGFQACQSGSSTVLLAVTVLPTSDAWNVWLYVERRNPPTNWSFNCPLITQCDAPVYTARCVLGASFGINSDSYACSEVPINPTSWTVVKGLFR